MEGEIVRRKLAKGRQSGPPRLPGVGATAHAVNALTQAIRDGRYAPGERLVESRLTAELGVSRSSVREALRRLEANGLVRVALNRGAVVRALEPADVVEILEVREVLEGLAAALAARRIDRHDNRSRARAMLRRVETIRAGELEVDHLEDNTAFHDFVLELGGNRTLAHQVRQLQLPAIRAWFFDRLNASDWDRSLAEHQQILEAVLEGDPVLAQQLMCAHVRRTRRRFETLPD